MSPAAHLSEAQKLIKDGASQRELSRARDHLNAIPENTPQTAEAKKLMTDLEARMKNLNGSGSSGKKAR